MGRCKVLGFRFHTVAHYHLSSIDAAVGHDMEVQLFDPGPDVHGTDDVISGGSCSYCGLKVRVKAGSGCEFCQGPFSWKVKLYPNTNVAKGLPLCGYANSILRSFGLDSWDPAGQRQHEDGTASDHSVGRHTFQSVGVDQL